MAVIQLTTTWRRFGPELPPLSTEVLEELGTNNYISRLYIETDAPDGERGRIVDLHCAYYTGMIDTVPHVPERCFVGGGLQQSESSRVIDIPMDTSNWRVDETVPTEFAGVDGKIYTVRLSNNSSMSDAPGRRVRLPRGISPEQPFKFRASEFINPGKGNVYAGYFFIANGGTKANANDVRQLAFNLEERRFQFFVRCDSGGRLRAARALRISASGFVLPGASGGS